MFSIAASWDTKSHLPDFFLESETSCKNLNTCNNLHKPHNWLQLDRTPTSADENTHILPEHELVEKKFSVSLIYWIKPLIGSSILPFLLKSAWERTANFWFSNAAAILFLIVTPLAREIRGSMQARPPRDKTRAILLEKTTAKMLRRKPTRIELRQEDRDEYEKARKLWSKEPQKVEESTQFNGIPAYLSLNDPARIARVHERIGFNAQAVPSDGTTQLSS